MEIIVGVIVIEAAYTGTIIIELSKAGANLFGYYLLTLQVILMRYSGYYFFSSYTLIVVSIGVYCIAVFITYFQALHIPSCQET